MKKPSYTDGFFVSTYQIHMKNIQNYPTLGEITSTIRRSLSLNV